MSDQSTMSGACYCRKICYDLSQVDSQTLDGVVCHCTTCQKLHTMVSYNVALKREQLKLAKGEPKMYEDLGADNGKRILRYFCGDCGSGLYSYPDSMPDTVFVKAGSINELDRVVPRVEIYVERAINGTTRGAKERKTTLFEGMKKRQIS